MTNHRVPLHIAIIPDGNRRWAAAQNLPPWKGHEAGADRVRDLARRAFADGATHVTVWGSSTGNLTRRTPAEVARLLDVYTSSLQRLLDDGTDETVRARVRIIGSWRERFPATLATLADNVERVTAANTGGTLTLLLSYDGTEEMLGAVRDMIAAGMTPADVTAETLKQHLLTRDLPPVDLVVRTGGEPHWSAGFMMWDIAEAHFHFTDTLFPDFTPDMLSAAITTFLGRTRRLGS